jgi:hypothetical protein
MAQVAELHSDTEAVVLAAVLADEGDVGTRERRKADQLGFFGWKRDQCRALIRREQLAARHGTLVAGGTR